MSSLDGLTCYVRVLSVRRERFVEFEFALGDPELSVELVMPFDRFEAFRTHNDAVLLEATPDARAALERLRWRHGAPGRETRGASHPEGGKQ